MTLAHKSPIVNSIVFNLIREVHFEKFKSSRKETIDYAVVPSVSETILTKRGFQQSISVPQKQIAYPIIPKIVPRESPIQPPVSKPQELSPLAKVNEGPPGFQESILTSGNPSNVQPTPVRINPSLTQKIIPQNVINLPKTTPLPVPPQFAINLFQSPPNYGKLNMLIRDPSVMYIDCQGPNKRIFVVKNGQKQQTNIALAKEEIQMLLENLSNKTKIPLVAGVFRVSWDNFIINATISDTLESKFLIKRGI